MEFMSDIKKYFIIIKLINYMGSVVYLYGYFLISYLIGEKLVIFSEILLEVQNKKQNQVAKLVEQFGLVEKDNFQAWMQSKFSQLIILFFI